MKLSDADRDKLRELVAGATDAKNLIIEREIDEAFSDVLAGDLAAMLKIAQSKDNFVKLHTAHLVVYDIMIEGNLPMEHLSISHPKKLSIDDVLAIATEFGLGDRTTWTASMEPVPPIKAFHIFRVITANAKGCLCSVTLRTNRRTSNGFARPRICIVIRDS
jgi:hypothetical protein